MQISVGESGGGTLLSIITMDNNNKISHKKKKYKCKLCRTECSTNKIGISGNKVRELRIINSLNYCLNCSKKQNSSSSSLSSSPSSHHASRTTTIVTRSLSVPPAPRFSPPPDDVPPNLPTPSSSPSSSSSTTTAATTTNPPRPRFSRSSSPSGHRKNSFDNELNKKFKEKSNPALGTACKNFILESKNHPPLTVIAITNAVKTYNKAGNTSKCYKKKVLDFVADKLKCQYLLREFSALSPARILANFPLQNFNT